MILSFADAARQATAQAGLPAVSQLSHHQSKINLMEHLIQEVASPRTYTLLKEYYKQSKVFSAQPSILLGRACLQGIPDVEGLSRTEKNHCIPQSFKACQAVIMVFQ